MEEINNDICTDNKMKTSVEKIKNYTNFIANRLEDILEDLQDNEEIFTMEVFVDKMCTLSKEIQSTYFSIKCNTEDGEEQKELVELMMRDTKMLFGYIDFIQGIYDGIFDFYKEVNEFYDIQIDIFKTLLAAIKIATIDILTYLESLKIKN